MSTMYNREREVVFRLYPKYSALCPPSSKHGDFCPSPQPFVLFSVLTNEQDLLKG